MPSLAGTPYHSITSIWTVWTRCRRGHARRWAAPSAHTPLTRPSHLAPQIGARVLTKTPRTRLPLHSEQVRTWGGRTVPQACRPAVGFENWGAVLYRLYVTNRSLFVRFYEHRIAFLSNGAFLNRAFSFHRTGILATKCLLLHTRTSTYGFF